MISPLVWKKMEVVPFFLGLEVPKIFSNLAIIYPDNAIVAFCYHASVIKYNIWDVYQFQIQTDYTAAQIFLGGLLLLNISRFCNNLALVFRHRLQSDFCAELDGHISAFVYVARAVVLASAGVCSPYVFIGHVTLALSANAYYSTKPPNRSAYVFYIVALHFILVTQIWEAMILSEPLLLGGTVWVHLLGCAIQIQVSFSDTMDDVYAGEFITHFCACFDFFALHLLHANLGSDMWWGSLEMYTIFMLLYFESFGKLTSGLTQLLFILHSVTVSQLCARAVEFSSFTA